MLVRTYGFSIKSENPAIGLADIFASIATESGSSDISLSNERRIYLDTTSYPDFAVGLVVTVKDQKTFCELVNDAGHLVISVSSITGENKLMEFNFFVANKANGLGLYQHYHQSCSPGTFGTYLRKAYRRLSDSIRDKEISDLKKTIAYTERKEKKISSRFRKSLSFSLLVHAESLEKVLLRFKRIKALEYALAELQPEVIKGLPVGNQVKLIRQKLSFFAGAAVEPLAKAVQATVQKLKIKSGHVLVVDEVEGEDVPMSVKLADIPQHFGEVDYDDVAAKLDNLDVTKMASHSVVSELRKVASEDFKHIFMKKLK